VRIERLRFHVLDIEDHAVLVDESDRQRDERVLHPDRVVSRLVEDEEHPVFLPEGFAEHEALEALWLLDRELDLQRMAGHLDL
jgi:hypothetical protein